jgi:UDP-N-acetylmuramoyl-L-alanyl-D-glutamate--2,6-diaminopimelate ligase
MLLSRLLHDLPFEVSLPLGDPDITGVVSDSRLVKPGNLFVAFQGGRFDAHRFIPQAVAGGAVAVVGMQPGLQPGVPYVCVDDSRHTLPYLAAAFYGHPAHYLTMIGVTGTDGKTTTTNLVYQILLAAGLNAGMISTVNAVIGDQILDTGFHVTTPDAPDIQRYLKMMLDAGITHAVLETTSHGLAQHRVDACEFDIGVVTNITHEHLDEHSSYENYLAAKARLFTSLAETPPKPQVRRRLAVLNRDDASFGRLSPLITVPQVSYGFSTSAQIQAQDILYHKGGLQFLAQGPGFSVPVQSSLTGNFNVSNCLAAIGVAVSGLGLEPSAVQQGFAALPGIPGRMEFIDLGQDFDAIVDFAHTPNALKSALETARALAGGRVIAVFGSAGLRDREKRRLMSEISAQLADLTVLTAEDPRTESLDLILAEMAAGAQSQGGVEGQTFWRVPDRGDAIRKAVSLAKPGDLVIACGKGHEQSMCFGEVEYAWDDRIALRAALSELLGILGPSMPGLPTSKS